MIFNHGSVDRSFRSSTRRPAAILAAASLLSLAGTMTGPITGMSNQATAGEILRLKAAGSIPLQDQSNRLAMGALSHADAYFVIQFKSGITEADKRALSSRGMEVLRYLPDDALLVRGKAQTAAFSSTIASNVRAASPFHAEWKLSPELANMSGTEELLVSTFDEQSSAAVQRALALIPGVKFERALGVDLLVSADVTQLNALARIEGIEWIQPVPRLVEYTMIFGESPAPLALTPKDHPAYTGYESGTKVMNFDAAWGRGYFGEGQIVAVGDTGLDSGNASTLHPDFQGNFLKGYAAGLGADSWEDSMGHGTHVSGSVLGNGSASDGKIRGGAHHAKLIMMGLWSSILDNLAPGSDFAGIADSAYKDGARIHTNSWGNAKSLGDYDTMAAKVDEYMWKHPDMLVLFAAGNSGEDANADGRIDDNSIGSPGTAKNVLTVGASENLLAEGGIQKTLGQLRDGTKKWGVAPLKDDKLSDNPNGIAAFSSRGPTADGRIKPEIVAPGTNIVSTRSRNPKASPLWGEYDGFYVYSGGTSMATPLTAGAAAVAREYLIKDRGIANPSAALVKATLMHTATDLFPGQYGTGPKQELPTRRPNVHEGYGRVNMDAATNLGTQTHLYDDTAGVGKGEEKSFTIDVAAGATFRAVMTYTDAPGSASARQALVNDLDLKVTTPSGEVIAPQDRVNNTEIVELTGAKSGTYRVTISGANVPQGKNGKQPFALIVGSY